MRKNSGQKVIIDSFDLAAGRKMAGKYEVLSLLGSGWEGEVYKIREIRTGIERAAKLFFPQRNIGNKTAKSYAQKLHKLRQVPILIKYHTEEILLIRKFPITVLISEYVEGDLLSEFLKKFPGQRLHPYQALHLLYALTCGIEEIHLLNETHGDLHTDNIIINRFGLEFDVKLLDLFHGPYPKKETRQTDILELIRIFYDTLGGAKRYSKLPVTVKQICCGLKRSLILDRFRTISHLREHLESLDWSSDTF
ncbi:MAG: protein kinase [Nitrospinota bacterium]|nr:protein kinase [Nitrospinota bacterium]